MIFKNILLSLLIILSSATAHAEQYEIIDLKENVKKAYEFCAKHRANIHDKLPMCSIHVDGVEGLFQAGGVDAGKFTWIYTQYQTFDKTRVLSLFEKVVAATYALYGPPTKKYDQFHILWKKYNVTISLEHVENKNYVLVISQHSGSL
jgi:hypothetical protein